MAASTLAARLVAAMKVKGYQLDTGPAEVNIIYVEGMGPDGIVNDNAPNKFNDARFVVRFVNGAPVLAGAWEATTEPSRHWTLQPMNSKGAARIKFGQYRAWQVGVHNSNHEALVQRGAVTVCRDLNKDFKRAGDTEDTGTGFGINQHWGYDLPKDDLGTSSAGCLVGRTKPGHREFMAIVKADPRYLNDSRFMFRAAILHANDLPKESGLAQPTPPAKPATTGKPVLKLTPDAVRKCFPSASQAIVDAFVDRQGVLAAAGILDTPQRLAYCFANLAHETGDWRIRNLTENVNYTADRAAVIWPSRFASAQDVEDKYGIADGWQLSMFDDVYGNRMGNRPGTKDGSRYIGRGGPQITGREGYLEIGKRTGLPLVDQPELATLPQNQPAIAAAYWSWKNMNALADAGDFTAVVKRWNGGTIGLPDRQAKLARMIPVAKSLGRGSVTPAAAGTGGGIVVMGGVAAAEAARQGYGAKTIIGILLAVAIAAVIGYFVVKSMRKP